MQECCKLTVFCKNLASCLLPVKFWKDIFYLQESGRISIACKNLARYLFFKRILQDSLNLEDFCKVFINCKNLQCYLIIARILHVGSFMEWKNLATYLLVSCKMSNICKNFAECLLFSGSLPNNCFLRVY